MTSFASILRLAIFVPKLVSHRPDKPRCDHQQRHLCDHTQNKHQFSCHPATPLYHPSTVTLPLYHTFPIFSPKTSLYLKTGQRKRLPQTFTAVFQIPADSPGYLKDVLGDSRVALNTAFFQQIGRDLAQPRSSTAIYFPASSASRSSFDALFSRNIRMAKRNMLRLFASFI